jgi:hypothetical protein
VRGGAGKGLVGGALEGAIPLYAGSEVLVGEHGIEDGGGFGAVAGAVAGEQAGGVPGGVADVGVGVVVEVVAAGLGAEEVSGLVEALGAEFEGGVEELA